MNKILFFISIMIFSKGFLFNKENILNSLSQICVQETGQHYEQYLQKINWHSREQEKSNDFISHIKFGGSIFQYSSMNAVKVWEINYENNENQFNQILNYLQNMTLFPYEIFINHISLKCAFLASEEKVYIFSLSKYMTLNLEEQFSLLRQSHDKNLFPFVLDRAFKILIAVNKIHKNGKIHGGLEPTNILIDDIYTPVISDLKNLTDQTNPKTNTGLQGIYNDPLMLDQGSEFRYDVQSDIFALGMIFLQMFSTQTITSNNIEEIMNDYIMIEERDNKYEELKSIFVGMCFKDKANRESDLQNVIFKFLQFYKYYYTNIRDQSYLSNFWREEQISYDFIQLTQEKFLKIRLLQERKSLIKGIIKDQNIDLDIQKLNVIEPKPMNINDKNSSLALSDKKYQMKSLIPPQVFQQMQNEKKKMKALEQQLIRQEQKLNELQNKQPDEDPGIFWNVLNAIGCGKRTYIII